ncbi:hypothetical protein ACFQ2B_27710 [Streptomyces stramineus]|uniref:Uncharacterized protein n=1 Tax=Streptomyces stramineus TaxID=173861 RepID=A0ABN0ZNP8_9ACTN
MTDTSLAADQLRALLIRCVTDGAHHARAAAASHTPEGALVHDGFTAGFHHAAMYAADLLATGSIQARGGHRVPDNDQTAAEHLADHLPDNPGQRARLIGGTIRNACATVTAANRTHPEGNRPEGMGSTHVYLSTGCLHGQHDYRQSNTGSNGTKMPASCKFCRAACVCDCHQVAVAPDREIPVP